MGERYIFVAHKGQQKELKMNLEITNETIAMLADAI